MRGTHAAFVGLHLRDSEDASDSYITQLHWNVTQLLGKKVSTVVLEDNFQGHITGCIVC